MRTGFVVIGFALAGAIGSAAAQYFPPQPPPAGYPPSAHDPYPASSPPPNQRADPYPDTAGEPYGDPYDGPYLAQPHPTIGDTQRQSLDGIISEPLAPLATSPQDGGTEVAALPPEYEPERGPPVELRPQFRRTVVDYPTIEPPGTIIIDTPNTYLYLTLDHGKAIRYGVGVGREGFTWSGTERVSRMKEWPDWLPPKAMIARQPYLPRFMAGGETNPLGARAMYLGNTVYRIHGTNQPSTIGSFVSSGCIRLTNDDVEDLYSRVTVGTPVVVLPGANTEATPRLTK